MNAVRGLYIVPTDYADLQRKGVTHMLRDRELESDFERLITIHPWAQQQRRITLSPIHQLIEFREYFLPFCDRWKPLRYLHHIAHFSRVAGAILRILIKERIQFIRATDPVYSGLMAWFVTRLVRLPYGVSIHADYDKRFVLDPDQGAPTFAGSRAFAKRLEKLVLQSAEAVLPIRQSLADKVIENGVPIEKVRVIPHGIHTEIFVKPSAIPVADRFSIPPNRRILSFVGRLSKENYVDDLLLLAERLTAQRSDFMIVIAGEGPERSRLQAHIELKRLSAFIKLIGAQPQDVVISLRQSSTVSLCLMGGFSLIEACAVGRPVIAYDVEWHSELVQTGQTGWLIPEHDVEALVRAVHESLDQPDEAARRGLAAQALAIARHDIRSTSALKKEVYQSLLLRAAQ